MFKPVEVRALRTVFDDYFAHDHTEGHIAITLEEHGEIVGFTYYAPNPMGDRTWQLWWIVVRKDQQGRGVGTRLLRHVEDDIRHRSGRLLFIETGSIPPYEKTRQFYRKHGFEQIAQLDDFYADGDSMVVFRKRLGS